MRVGISEKVFKVRGQDRVIFNNRLQILVIFRIHYCCVNACYDGGDAH